MNADDDTKIDAFACLANDPATQAGGRRGRSENDTKIAAKNGKPPRARGPSSKPEGRKAAIEAMCRECIYDPTASGGWRQQVAACSCTTCPLFSFRPIPRTTLEVSQ